MWTFANLGKKVYEIVPSRIDFDAASAVIFVAFIVLIAATAVHTSPGSVERMAFSSCDTSIYQKTFYTTARMNEVGFERVGGSDMGIFAVASAYPVPSTFDAFVRLNSDQSTKTLTSDINFSGHRAATTVRGSSDGADANTSVPLRIVAWV